MFSLLLDPRFQVSATESGTVIAAATHTAGAAAAAGAGAAAAGPEAGAGAAGDVVLGEDGKPLTKSALKKLRKRQAMAAKRKDKPAAPPAAGKNAGKRAQKKKAAAKPAFVFVDDTPPGEKKDVTKPMLEAYHPPAVEASWDAWWTASGFYSCDPAAAAAAAPEDKFVMVIPPPNVTGSLHLGHALMASIEDALVRWHRMSGKHVMWLPGTDHAGIATQSVVERRLLRDRGVTRHDLGREAFLKEVWAWKEQYGSRITKQMRCLGVSVDWSRERFTMDDQLNKAVKEAFFRMHRGGLVKRNNRLVNWSCALSTALSNIEVDTIDVPAFYKMKVPSHDNKIYEFGVLILFAYKVADSDEEVVIATTRLETMLGDTAVAVHPDDKRYAHLVGKELVHPFNGRRIPIITDGKLVDMEFGTGAVKITPAHDPNDFAAGKRNGLPMINILDDNGLINDEGGDLFRGMRRFDARIAIAKALEERGLLRGKEGNKMSLPLCSRSGDIIEPMLKPQWWVSCDGMAKRALDVVESGELKIEPEFHKDTWRHWLSNPQDWCVSRQLWWGHRIPAWYASLPGEGGKPPEEDESRWIVARDEDEARAMASATLGVPAADITLDQDPDVLDTWFSSGLFPFSTFGWPDETLDLQAFFPNTLLETGHDILFFWVARMVMMSLYLMDKLPFETVYLHAMVRDKYGRKMSKALGNVVDPLEVTRGCTLDSLQERIKSGNLPAHEVKKSCEGQALDFPDGIPECGADALRFGLLAYTLQGRDINLDINRVVSYRHFCNKLWNATRFALQNFDGYVHDLPLDALVESLQAGTAARDRWILSKLAFTVRQVTEAFAQYNFADACTALYNFWYNRLCNVYLELIKPVMHGSDEHAKLVARRTLVLCMELGLRLLHPTMPFVTEELWNRLPTRLQPDTAGAAPSPSVMIARWPALMPAFEDAALETAFSFAESVSAAMRSQRQAFGISSLKKKSQHVVVSSRGAELDALREDVMVNGGADELDIVADTPADAASMPSAVVDETTVVFMKLGAAVDVGVALRKSTKAHDTALKNVAAMERKLAQPQYKSKAPEELQQEDAARLLALKDELTQTKLALDRMEQLAAASGARK